ncbi:tubulin/FtsZ family protein [Haloarcula laminariae]|uniref:tubulin/FtsZ family protein n=1 Tax=Haloarcula laminariae TaxID=2961577 RepID=UPI0021C9DE93|nr:MULTISPECIES: tubulin/FtsZ family protein [Halomicroarcula]
MHVAVIGFGNAGGKIADAMLEFEADTGRSLCKDVLAVNSAEIDLAKPDHVPEDRRLLIGQTHERVKGRGVGANPELGAEVARRDLGEIDRALDDVPVYEIDAFLVVAGLGGGTGSGGAPVVSRHLREMYAEPVYGLGVLPSADEGGRASLNAARSLQSFTDATDSLVLFDNDAWRQAGETLQSGYDHANTELARRVTTLLGAGALDDSTVSETAMDASDINRTLSTDGVSTIAYASADLDRETKSGLLDQFRTNGHADTDYAQKVHGLVRRAVNARLTCPADVESAERSLAVVSGPPEELSRKGLQHARQWLESQTDSVEVLAGDDPREDADRLSVAVLLSNVTDVPRVDTLQERAVDAQDRIEAEASARDDEVAELVTDENDELDPI